MQQRLALALGAHDVTALAVALDLAHVPAHRLPTLNLARVLLWLAPAEVVAAVPLEPAARVILVDPPLSPPFSQRLARVGAEVVELAVALPVRAWRA